MTRNFCWPELGGTDKEYPFPTMQRAKRCLLDSTMRLVGTRCWHFASTNRTISSGRSHSAASWVNNILAEELYRLTTYLSSGFHIFLHALLIEHNQLRRGATI